MPVCCEKCLVRPPIGGCGSRYSLEPTSGGWTLQKADGFRERGAMEHARQTFFPGAAGQPAESWWLDTAPAIAAALACYCAPAAVWELLAALRELDEPDCSGRSALDVVVRARRFDLVERMADLRYARCSAQAFAELLLQRPQVAEAACRAQRRVPEFCSFVARELLAQSVEVPNARNNLKQTPRTCLPLLGNLLRTPSKPPNTLPRSSSPSGVLARGARHREPPRRLRAPGAGDARPRGGVPDGRRAPLREGLEPARPHRAARPQGRDQAPQPMPF